MSKAKKTKKPKKIIWETYSAPAWAWERIWQSVKLSCRSSASTPDLRTMMQEAADAVELMEKCK